MAPPWVFDVVVAGLIILSAVMSIGRGLIREAFSVVSFAIGGLAAWLCLKFFEPPLKQIISPNEPSIVPSIILVVVGFLVAYALAAFLGSRMSKLIHSSPEIGALDRIAGAAFGVVRGILAAVLFVLLVHQVVRPGEEPDWLAKSQSYPYLNSVAGAVGGALTTVIEFFMGKAAPPPTP
ncbi:MAG: CvpA family protein [Hyphomonadaceae bacterium]